MLAYHNLKLSVVLSKPNNYVELLYQIPVCCVVKAQIVRVFLKCSIKVYNYGKPIHQIIGIATITSEMKTN